MTIFVVSELKTKKSKALRKSSRASRKAKKIKKSVSLKINETPSSTVKHCSVEVKTEPRTEAESDNSSE